MFRVITIEREFGCGGGAIAGKLASRLGWTLWDQRLSQEIAGMAEVDCAVVNGCDEKLDGRLYRLTKLFFRGSNDRGTQLADAKVFDADCMVAMMESLTKRIADEGNSVVVGRGAPYFLRQRNDALHIFLYAPRAEKLRRLRASGPSERDAEHLVDTVDRERMAFVKHYFHADWPTRALYHLMLNTVIGDDQIVATIMDTMRQLEKASGAREVQPTH